LPYYYNRVGGVCQGLFGILFSKIAN
jgi:hypothetical protein